MYPNIFLSKEGHDWNKKLEPYLTSQSITNCIFNFKNHKYLEQYENSDLYTEHEFYDWSQEKSQG